MSNSAITAPTQFLQTPKEKYAYRRFGKKSKYPLLCLLVPERNLFMRFCVSDEVLAAWRSYETKKITAPYRSIEA